MKNDEENKDESENYKHIKNENDDENYENTENYEDDEVSV